MSDNVLDVDCCYGVHEIRGFYNILDLCSLILKRFLSFIKDLLRMWSICSLELDNFSFWFHFLKFVFSRSHDYL